MRAALSIQSVRRFLEQPRLLSGFAITSIVAVVAGSIAAVSIKPTADLTAIAAVEPSTDIVGTEGFWRIARDTDGVQWFLSPDGQREFLNTVTTVQPIQLGRKATGPHFVSRDWSGDADMDGDLDAWASATLGRVTSAGFKGLGAWSHPVFHDYDVPITRDLNIWTWMSGPAKRLYHPEFAMIAEKAVRQQVTPLRDNRNLVGYYTDNELDWSDKSSGPAAYFDWLDPSTPSRQAVMRSVRRVWADVEAFNADWDTDLASFDELDGWTYLPRDNNAAYNKLLVDFRGQLAADYFEITSNLVRKYDPNHLILGVRYKGWAPPEVVRAQAGRTDAVSINYYVADARLDRTLFEMLHDESGGQPVIITEYSFHALDGRSGNRNTFGFSAQVPDQTARADGYREMTEGLASVPFVIGADWFQWNDEPPSGRRGDGEDVNFGIVDVDDIAYDHLIDAVRETTPRLNDIHAASSMNTPVWRRSFDKRPTWTMPRLRRVPRIDGNLVDWSEEHRLPDVSRGETVGLERSPHPEPETYLGWTDDGLYVGMVVHDADIHGAPITGNWWTRDCVELFIRTAPTDDATDSYSAHDHQFFFVPIAFPGPDGAAGYTGQWNRPGDAIDATLSPHPAVIDAARVLPGRYVVELFIPANALHGFDPLGDDMGDTELGFNLHVTNFQNATSYFWSAPKEARTQHRPNTWGTIKLGK
ncbi:MAG: hypothetical protein AAGD32_02380 [Planctomycetota bacterium]